MAEYNLFKLGPTIAEQGEQLLKTGKVETPQERWSREHAGMLSPGVAPQGTVSSNLQGSTGTVSPVSKPTGPVESAGINYLNSMLTTPEEEERMRRSSVNRQRILAVGDALRHIGNIYHTVQGAPAQVFNNPSEMERQRYQEEKSLRDANNLKVLSYEQARAAQEAKQQQWNREFDLKLEDAARKAGYTNAQIKALQDRVAESGRHNAVLEAIQQGRLDEYVRANRANESERARHNRRTEGIAGSRLALDREKWNYRRRNGGGGRDSAPFVYPTKNGRITLGRDLNENSAGKRALLVGELRKRNQLSPDWERNYQWASESDKDRMLSGAIGEWLMKDPEAVDYMRDHFGAEYIGDPYTPAPSASPESYGLFPWNSGNDENEDDWDKYIIE